MSYKIVDKMESKPSVEAKNTALTLEVGFRWECGLASCRGTMQACKPGNLVT